MRLHPNSEKDPQKSECRGCPQVTQEESNMDDYELEVAVHIIHTEKQKKRAAAVPPHAQVQIWTQLLTALVDTGASINLMSHELYSSLMDLLKLKTTQV
ncbi:hypothetical protein NDU88_007588 [Pleurodeles waltl]|uniref:Uncharacterized protein n=1 Tax=Pleurodeles waltl TaxID=8319 RepID=A0AAV7NAM3_PLEWA|nr:hypothetical protein NDU88_007588 [Pleurodeles waltl]